MSNYMIITVDATGKAMPMDDTLFPTWEDACEAQEALEAADDTLSYLIYTVDEWMYEVENGRA